MPTLFLGSLWLAIQIDIIDIMIPFDMNKHAVHSNKKHNSNPPKKSSSTPSRKNRKRSK